MTYTYDALGRVIHTQDPRHTGDSDIVYFTNSTLVDFIQNEPPTPTTRMVF